MNEADNFNESDINRMENDDYRPLGKVACAGIGLSITLGSFEILTALNEATSNHPIFNYSLNRQALGLALFSIAGGFIGRFIYEDERR